MRLLRCIASLLFMLTTLALALPARAQEPTADLDRATPRRALEGFIRACDGGDWARAAQYLDLRAVPKTRRAEEGPDQSEKLCYVLGRRARVDVSKVPDDADAEPPNSVTPVVASTIYMDEEPVPIALTRIKFDDGVARWLVSRSTVAMIPVLYQSMARSPLEEHVPEVLRAMILGNEAWEWIALLVAAPLAYGVGWCIVFVVFGIARVLARRTRSTADDILVESTRRPARLALGAILWFAAVLQLHMTLSVQSVVFHFTYTAVIVAIAWSAIGVLDAGIRFFQERIPEGSEAELAHRSLRTRLALFERVADALVLVLACAVLLVQFELVRSVGYSILASAGIAGVVLGFAAQKSIGGLIAGVQISITQPIRIGDSVVIEGESGRIQEINLTYVVVRIWDDRCLVVPVNRFLEQPFQNWSKIGPQMTGTVNLICDFTTPVSVVRAELLRICEGSPLWDKRACSLQVTDVSERTMTLRALVTSASSGALWDLRCEVREKLVAFLHELEGGRFMPRLRTEPKRDGDVLAA